MSQLRAFDGNEQTIARTDALFDTERYPIDQSGSQAYVALVDRARSELSEKNCVRLQNFLLPSVLTDMQAEAASLAPEATFTQKDLNPYFCQAPDDVAPDHPLRRFSPRRHGMIRADKFSRNRAAWTVFQNDDLCRFVADCLGYETLYTYRDPFGCVNVNVQPPGCEFAWHFDHNDFTVSFGLKQPVEGGTFEFVPNIRTRQSENFDDVKAVLDGDRRQVQSLQLQPGDLQLFRGGYTLHRVTAPDDDERFSLLLSYVTDPTRIASAEYAERLWGEAHALHRAQT